MAAPPGENRVTVEVTPEFDKSLRKLKKRYRNIRTDVTSAIKQIQIGNFIGDEISDTGYVVFKARIVNSDIKKGKRSGYRMIYKKEAQDRVLLLTLYSKSDRPNISVSEIRQIISKNAK